MARERNVCSFVLEINLNFIWILPEIYLKLWLLFLEKKTPALRKKSSCSRKKKSRLFEKIARVKFMTSENKGAGLRLWIRSFSKLIVGGRFEAKPLEKVDCLSPGLKLSQGEKMKFLVFWKYKKLFLRKKQQLEEKKELSERFKKKELVSTFRFVATGQRKKNKHLREKKQRRISVPRCGAGAPCGALGASPQTPREEKVSARQQF